MMFKKITLSLTATIALLAPVAATAQTEDATSMTVNVDDLDLSSRQDQARMYSRIKTAARMICGNTNGRSLEDFKLQKKCISEVVAGSQSQANLAVAKALPSHAIEMKLVQSNRG
jgi:UrcA family protein